ncbi:MAG: hypothetical protein HY924_14305 [Elusimicrobia bacterium]|nr:hypothetical protein [Elusimicrobiota bacterium]
MAKKPVVLLAVLDAVGLTTLEYLLRRHPGKVRFPNLSRLGLGSIVAPDLKARFGKASGRDFAAGVEQASASADSVIGHREMMGIIDDRTYGLFPEGFPPDFIRALEERIGRKTMYNRMAGGVEAIERNAAEHARTGRPIVYASKCDPVIQVAMDEAVVPVPEQHAIGEKVFELARERGIQVTRSISRAYVRSKSGEVTRTANRHDTVLPLDGRTLVDVLSSARVWTSAVGKTSDLVNTRYHETIKLTERAYLDPRLGLRFVHPKGKDTNPFVTQGVVNALTSAGACFRPNGAFIFANFVDCDSLYGHTRDIPGALASIAEFDRILPILERALGPGGLLMLTADHGMEHRPDYGFHHKEPVPLLVERIGGAASREFRPLAKAEGMTGIGRLIAEEFGCGKDYEVTRVRR